MSMEHQESPGEHHRQHSATGGERPYDHEMREVDWAVVWERQAERAALWPHWLDRADVRPGERVLDVGSGPGCTSLLIGERVGPTGRVWALDRAPAALDYLRARQAERPMAMVEPLLGSASAIPLPNGSVDCAVLAHMLLLVQ